MLFHSLFWALVDSSTHGLMSAAGWIAVELQVALPLRGKFLRVLLATALACAVDVDHFLAAGSVHLTEATSLSTRPLGHSTFLAVVAVLAICACVGLKQGIVPFWTPWMCLCAWISHHARDSFRRGFSFWPLMDSTPIPYWAYIFAEWCLPVLIATAINIQRPKVRSTPASILTV